MKKWVILWIMLLLSGEPLSVVAMQVKIFTDSAHPISWRLSNPAVHVEYYELDALPRLVDQMNRHIKGKDPHLARIAIRKMMRTYQRPLQQAVLGRSYADRYGIHDIPAMVFDDGRYEVKGQTNLTRALQEYQQWQQIQ